MTYSTCTGCKDPGFGFQVSTLASVRNMRDVQKNILTEQIWVNPLAPEGIIMAHPPQHVSDKNIQIQTDKLFLQFQLDMLKEK